MTERVRRPILHLKLGAGAPAPTPAAAPSALAPAAPAASETAPTAPVAYNWKCRPCGSSFVPPAEGPDDEAVRCPSCNARLGKAADFRSDPPALDRLRARAAKVPPPPPPSPPPRAASPRGARTRPPVVTVKVLKKVR